MGTDGASSLLYSLFYRIYIQIKCRVEWKFNWGGLFGYGNSNIPKLISKPNSLLLEDQRSEKGNKRHDHSGLLLTYVVIGGWALHNVVPWHRGSQNLTKKYINVFFFFFLRSLLYQHQKHQKKIKMHEWSPPRKTLLSNSNSVLMQAEHICQ